jgi:hypothetical protein
MAHKIELEESAESVGGEKERYLASIAVSLKRIAGVLEWGQGVAQNLGGSGGPKAVGDYITAVRDEIEADESAERAAGLKSGTVS